LQRQDPDASRHFWQSRLAGFAAPTPLLDPPAAPGAGGTGFVEKRLTAPQTHTLQAFARSHGCTAGTLVAGAWALLLHRYTGDDDVVFGVTRACRRSALPDADEVFGMLMHTLPLPVRIGRGRPPVQRRSVLTSPQ